MKQRLFTALCLLLPLFLWQASARAATGTLRGEVTNGTQAGGSVAGLEVSLWTHPAPQAKPVATTTAGAQGKFEFANVPIGDTGVYEVRVSYGDVDYLSDPIKLSAQQPNATTQVTVYDPTTDSSHVVTFMHHIRVLDVKNGRLHLGERMIVLNIADPRQGGRTYVGTRGEGGRRKVLRLALPEGAQNVEAQEEHGMAMMSGEGPATPLTVLEDGYVEMSPLLPTPLEALHGDGGMGDLKMRAVSYTYDLPLQNGRYDLSRSLDYMTVTFAVLSKDPALNVSCPTLEAGDDQEIRGQTWKVHLGKGIEPATRVEVIVMGRSFFASEQSMAWMMAILIFAACVVGVIVGTRVRRGNLLPQRGEPNPAVMKPSQAASKRARRQASLEEEREALINDIALLDERWEDGEISEEQYQGERASKKKRLIELTKRLQKLSS